MSEYSESARSTGVVSADVARYRRLKYASDGTWSHAGLGEQWQAVSTQDLTFVSGNTNEVSLHYRNKPGTLKLTASKSIAVNALVYGAAAGKITDSSSSSGNPIGRAKTAAAADGDIIEVIPLLAETA